MECEVVGCGVQGGWLWSVRRLVVGCEVVGCGVRGGWVEREVVGCGV